MKKKMKTIEEMIAVMKAFIEGKKIEYVSVIANEKIWNLTENPLWNWAIKDYRVKPEPHYVPYDSVVEVDRDKWVRRKDIFVVDK